MASKSDVRAALEVVRARYAALDTRCDTLRRELEETERERGRLAAAISVMDEFDVPGSSEPSPSALAPTPSPALDDRPLTDRVLEALGPSGLRRSELLQVFSCQDVTEAAVDSAVTRLQRRQLIVRNGKVILRSQPDGGASGSLVPLVPAVGRASAPRPASSAEARPGAESAESAGPPLLASAVSAPVPGPAAPRTLGERVSAVVARSGGCSRGDVVDTLVAQGNRKSSVTRTIRSLCSDGVLQRRGDDLVLAAPEPSAEAAGPESRES